MKRVHIFTEPLILFKTKVQKAGVVLNPSTPVWVLEDIITEVDLVLLMSVNPGFGGQNL